MTTIETTMAICGVRLIDRLLTKHRSKVNRVAYPYEAGRVYSDPGPRPGCVRFTGAKRAKLDSGRGRSRQVDSDSPRTAGRMDRRTGRRLERRRRRFQNHKRPPRLFKR